jgi:hypothetical protein
VNWTAPVNHATSDWVGLFRSGTPDTHDLSRQSVASATTGTLSFALPQTPGRYEFRYFIAGGLTRAAISNVLTVLPPPACAAQSNGQPNPPGPDPCAPQ